MVSIKKQSSRFLERLALSLLLFTSPAYSQKIDLVIPPHLEKIVMDLSAQQSSEQSDFGDKSPLPMEALPSSLKSIYESRIPKGKVVLWQSEELLAQFKMKAAQASPWYNTHLIWAIDSKSKKKLFGFRPIETLTGCHSGCTPVVFHLQIDVKGKTTAIFEEPSRRLEKVNHQQMTAADLKKALEIAQKLPEALRSVVHPYELTDHNSGFPEQTWTFFKPMLIPWAAYTSYRIHEAALKTYQAVSQKIPSVNKMDWVYRVYSIGNVKDLKQLLLDYQTELKSKTAPPELKAVLYTFSPPLLAQLLAMKHDELKFALEFLNTFPAYKTSHKNDICSFLNELVNSSAGRSLLMNWEKNKLPSCDKQQDALLTALAAHIENNEALLKTISTQLTFSGTEIPKFIGDNPKLSQHYSSLIAKLKPGADSEQTLAQLKTSLPKLFSKLQVNAKALEQSEKDYRKKLSLDFVPASERKDMPNVEVKKQGKKTSLIDALKTKPKPTVVVFFARWCPHCQDFIRDFEKKVSPSVLTQFRFVEIFQRTEASLDSFCKEEKLSSTFCSEILQLEPNSEASAFYKQMSILGVPRIVLVDQNQKTVLFDVPAHSKEGQDLYRNLSWMIEEVR